MGLMHVLLGIGGLFGAEALKRVACSPERYAKQEARFLSELQAETGLTPITNETAFWKNCAHMKRDTGMRIARAGTALDKLYASISWQSTNRLYIDPALQTMSDLVFNARLAPIRFTPHTPKAGLRQGGTRLCLVADTFVLDAAATNGASSEAWAGLIRQALQSVRQSYIVPDLPAYRQKRTMQLVLQGLSQRAAAAQAASEYPTIDDPTNKRVKRAPAEVRYFDQVTARILEITCVMSEDAANWYALQNGLLPSGKYLHEHGYMTAREYADIYNRRMIRGLK